jgi:NH3-dependent NAD+ synthetase
MHAVCDIREKTKNYDVIFTVGLPLLIDNKIYNACAVLYKGITYHIELKQKNNFLDIYDENHFESSRSLDCADSGDNEVLLFSEDFADNDFITPTHGCLIKTDCFSFKVCIGDDIIYGDNFFDNADIILNPMINTMSAKPNIIETKLKSISNTYHSIIIASTPIGEASSDYVYSSTPYIYEDGFEPLDLSFDCDENILSATCDVLSLRAKRTNDKSLYVDYREADSKYIIHDENFCSVSYDIEIFKNPFIYEVTKDSDDYEYGIESVFNILVAGLCNKLGNMAKLGNKGIVLGLSGGIDSTLALLVCNRSFELMNYDKKNMHIILMPSFGTTKATFERSEKMCDILGVDKRVIDITESVKLHLKDISHDINDKDVTFENAQARERTQILMDIANDTNSFVVGTSDLSEIALGFGTFGGDMLSMFNINSTVPKSLEREILYVYAENLVGNLNDVYSCDEDHCGCDHDHVEGSCGCMHHHTEEKGCECGNDNGNKECSCMGEHNKEDGCCGCKCEGKENNSNMKQELSDVIFEVVSAPVSPELLGDGKNEGEQNTEKILGPYELHDFFIYYAIYIGLDPKEVFERAKIAFNDEYDADFVKKTLKTFYKRFFASQFKRVVAPNGIDIGLLNLSKNDIDIPTEIDTKLFLDELDE